MLRHSNRCTVFSSALRSCEVVVCLLLSILYSTASHGQSVFCFYDDDNADPGDLLFCADADTNEPSIPSQYTGNIKVVTVPAGKTITIYEHGSYDGRADTFVEDEDGLYVVRTFWTAKAVA